MTIIKTSSVKSKPQPVVPKRPTRQPKPNLTLCKPAKESPIHHKIAGIAFGAAVSKGVELIIDIALKSLKLAV